MTPERYEVVRQIFDDVCDLPDAEREAAIDRACGADVELAAEVRTLLEHDAGATTSGDVEVHGFDLDDESVDEGLPERIGQYRVVRRIGAGGMGVVYEAQQDEPRRSVAIKILRADPAVTAIMRRFQREVHVLGLLRHSGIAQVYDAGRIETATGPRAYFAMEFVDGEPILEYARRCDLSVPDRLELVRRLCDAVQHAHAKGVVHRDLKPSNILVMADGQPKILDFGVARLMDPEGRGTSLHTQVGQLIGTLPYMSPEQASGVPDAVDTRSDVYALGILLYELLAARPPYDLADKMMHEALRVIQEDEPESLSRIERSLRGDVDTIVATALAKDKERRYQTASALSEDIRRFLDNEPIAARPPSAMYHLGKLVRRHRVAAALLTALVVVSIAFGIIGTVQAGQLRDASGRIAKESEEKSRRLYVSQIAQANLLRSDYNLEQMDAVLEACEEKRRGWEWRWLKSQVQPYQMAIRTEFSQLLAVGTWRGDLLSIGTDGDSIVGRRVRDEEEVFRVKAGDIVGSSMALSSSSNLLAVGDRIGVIRVWRISTGEMLLEEHVFYGPIGTVVFSKDESAVVVANHGQAVVNDDLYTKILMIGLDAPHNISGIMAQAPTIALAFDDWGRWLVVGQMSGEIRTFRRQADESYQPMDVAHLEPPLLAVTCLHDDRIAVSHGGRITLLNPVLGEEKILRGRHSESVRALASNGADLIATTDRDGKLLVQSILTGDPVLQVAAHDHASSQVAFMPNAEWLYTWSYDNELRIWSTRVGSGYEPNLAAGEDNLAVLDSQRSVVIAVGEGGRHLIARRLRSGNELGRVTLPAKAICAVFQPNRGRVVVGTEGGHLLAWDTESSKAEVLTVFEQPPTEIHASAGGTYLVALIDGELVCLDESGQFVNSSPWQVACAAVSQEESVITASEDGTLRVLRIPGFEVQSTIGPVVADIQMIRVDPFGETVAVATRDNTLICIAVSSGKVISRVAARMPTAAVAWLRDGSRVVTGGEDQIVRMWDPSSGDMLMSWAAPGPRVTQLWCLDDKIIARYVPGGVAEWSTSRPLNREEVLRLCFESASGEDDEKPRAFWEREETNRD